MTTPRDDGDERAWDATRLGAPPPRRRPTWRARSKRTPRAHATGSRPSRRSRSRAWCGR